MCEESGLSGIDLKIMRIRAGLKQYEVAQRLGVAPPVLSTLENGQRPVTRERAAAISAAIRALAKRGETGRGGGQLEEASPTECIREPARQAAPWATDGRAI